MRNIILLLLFVAGFCQKLYSQNTLQYYIKEAKHNSPLINKNENANKILQLDKQKIKSILSKPIINIESNILFAPVISHAYNQNKFQWISDNADSYTGYDLAYSDGGQYQAFISVKQPLFTGKTYKSYYEQANIQDQINTNNIDLTKRKLEQLVGHQYILCLTAKKQAEISKSLIDKLNNQILILQKLVDNAIYKQTDLMLLKIEIENFNIEYEKYLTEYSRNLYDLNLLCGINDTTVADLEEVNIKINTDTITYSKFINKFKLDSLNIITKQTVFDRNYKPQLSLFANAGLNAVYVPTLNRLGFATGINFTWNIFDGNQKAIQHNKSFIEIKTIEFEKQNFVNQYNTRKTKFLNQIKTIDKQINIVQNQLTEYEKLFKLYQIELSQAQISIMDFKNLIRDISEKKQENLRLYMQKEIFINSYNYWNY